MKWLLRGSLYACQCVCAKNTNAGINCAFVKAHKGEKTVDETAETRAQWVPRLCQTDRMQQGKVKQQQ